MLCCATCRSTHSRSEDTEHPAMCRRQLKVTSWLHAQARLNTMIGKSSGFVETLPKQVQARIQALRDLQDTHDEHETEYQKELKALQAKYDALYGELTPYGLYTAVLDLVDFTLSSCAPCCFAPEGNIESACPPLLLVFFMGKSCAILSFCHTS